jgi:hypothetical protein
MENQATASIMTIRKLVGSFLSSDENIAVFAENAPNWLRDLGAWYEETEPCPGCGQMSGCEPSCKFWPDHDGEEK